MNQPLAIAGAEEKDLTSRRPPPISVPFPRHERLDLLREMLATLEDATPAGQGYMMTKILPLLRQEALDPSARLKGAERDLILKSLDDLEHETSRLAPDALAFDRKAQILVDVLALT